MRPAAGPPRGALVLLHGHGSDERDLLPLGDALDPDREHVVVTARAPHNVPTGGAAWYLRPRPGEPDPATMLTSASKLRTWLDALPDRTGVPLTRTVVGGFSQGGAMSYVAALATGWLRLAGIICCGTFIPDVPGLELDDARALDLPVFIAHGTLDPVIPVRHGRDAAARLRAAGADVTYRETPVPHMIDRRHVPPMAEWLAATLAP